MMVKKWFYESRTHEIEYFSLVRCSVVELLVVFKNEKTTEDISAG